MKHIFIFIVLNFVIVSILVSQRIEINFGIVNSKVNFFHHSYQPVGNRPFATSNWKVFPTIGYRLAFDINSSWKFGFGFDVFKVGGRDFYPYNDTLKVKIIDFKAGDTINLFHPYPRNLLIHTVRVPIFISKNIFRWLNFELGYSLSYSFRKNFPFVVGLFPEDQADYYNPFSHQLIGGISILYRDFSFRALYNYSFTYFFDTGRHYNVHLPDQYWEMRARSQFFSLTIGYTFKSF